MTHTRYWAASLMTAMAGGFIVVERFAFGVSAVVWIAFGVAIGATVVSLAGLGVALRRENHTFSGLSATCLFVASWTIIAMLVFSHTTAMWLAFAAGTVLLAVSVRALALHEATVERVVYALERGDPVHAAIQAAEPAETAPEARASANESALARRLEVGAPMRNWPYWLSHTALALAGTFIVLMTFALTAPETHYYASPRWIAFAVAIGTLCVAVAALAHRALRSLAGDRTRLVNGQIGPRALALTLTGASAMVSAALIVTMAIYTGATAQWIAFSLGCGLIGVSLLAQMAHELSSERVRHELQVAEPVRQAQPAAAATTPAV